MKKPLIILFAICFVLLLAGCYDNRETDTLATVMAVGIDKADESNIKNYTFAVADTGGISGGDKGDGTSLICFSTESKDVHSAIRTLNEKISKQLSFSHLSTVLFSRDAAGEDMHGDVMYFEKKISVRPQTMIAVTDMKAGDYLEGLKPILEVNPEKYFQSVFKKAYFSDMTISDFTNAYYTKTSVMAPVIKISDGEDEYSEKNSYISEAALIYGGKLILAIEDTWILGLLKDNGDVMYKNALVKSVKKPRMSVDMKSGAPVLDAHIYVTSDEDVNWNDMEKDIEDTLSRYAEKACDILNITELAKKKFFLIKNYEKYDFKKLIKDTKFNITVSAVPKE